MPKNHNHQRSSKNHRKRPASRAERLAWIGGITLAAVALGGAAEGRQIVKNAWNEEQAPVKTQSVNQEQEPRVVLKYDREKDKALFGFADRHLQGDPVSHLDELHDQLPEGTPEGRYDVPDGWTFQVPASELDDPADEQIVGMADSASDS